MKKKINVSEEVKGSINLIIQLEVEVGCLKKEIKREKAMINMRIETAGLPDIFWDVDNQAKCKNVYALSLLTEKETEEMSTSSNYFAEQIVIEKMKSR